VFYAVVAYWLKLDLVLFEVFQYFFSALEDLSHELQYPEE